MPAARATSSWLPTAIAVYRGMRDGDGAVCREFPRRSGARDRRGACSTPASRASRGDGVIVFAAALGLVEYSAALNPLDRHPVPARRSRRHLWRDRRASAGLKQLRIAETEKYAHVTFFFNGGRENRLPGREAHPGAVAEGRDLRPEARDVGARGHRQGGRGDRGRRCRRHRAQLRQCRHGRAHRADRCRDPGGRGDRRLSRAAGAGGRGAAAARCSSPPTTAMPR